VIKIPTTLILGAGASAHLGFPLGYKLVQLMCARGVGKTQSQITKRLVRAGVLPADAAQFEYELSRSGRLSVDAFLEHRRGLIPIGKTAIAAALIEHEDEQTLHAKPDTPNWYDLLWHATRASFQDWGNNQLSIITFNYDRSLEHYLLCALSASFGKSRAEAAEQLKKIPILHVHGSMGELPIFDPNGREYSPGIDNASIHRAAAGIRIVCEPGDQDSCFTDARKILRGSQRIHFLGFGYDPTNIDRLGGRDLCGGKQVRGTCYGLNETEKEVVKSRLAGISLWRATDTIQEYLREARLDT
jgi:hypothetical protein